MKAKPYGVMFHHFFNEKHPVGQGTISAKQLADIIEYIGLRNILPAAEWLDKAKKNLLENNDICLTFDDTLLCQYDIAFPVLQKYSLTAIWFVYTSVVTGGIEMLEVYRKFRTVKFKDIESFYSEFFVILEKSECAKLAKKALLEFNPDDYLTDFSFYSDNDKKFRYLRDKVLGLGNYYKVMDLMLKSYSIDIKEFSSDLWMREDHIKKLQAKGHVIGSHSHTHPTVMSALTPKEQEKEYETSLSILEDILGVKPEVMSHPCNSYNQDTLKILTKLGIKVGFRANMKEPILSSLEFPREDHANIIRRLEL